MKKRFFIVLAISIISCTTKVLPGKFNLEKQQSFYVGLYDLVIYDIEDTDLIYEIETFKNYPIFKDVFDEDYMVQNWGRLNTDSAIYNNLKNSIESVKNQVTPKEKSKWIKDFLIDLKSNEKDFYIAGVYRKIGPKNVYYYYYLVNTKNNKLIVIENTN
ncbi:hypothetical protein [Pricia sp.]|uniref:hypothetical protein n=1 Tax=Pricia sp. TaxID=2268138 RepID=UPI003594032D